FGFGAFFVFHTRCPKFLGSPTFKTGEIIMAINTRNSQSNTTYLRYSAFLGMMYVHSKESEAALAAVKAEVGDAVWKKGFTGNSGDSPTGKALASLKEKGIVPVCIGGRLTNACVTARESNGQKHQYLNVKLTDNGENYVLSVDLGHHSTQMLCRKLFNAVPNEETTINLFATYKAKPGATQTYADHGASVTQDDTEVIGVDPREMLRPRVDAALNALKGVIPDCDKETLGKRKAKVEQEFHQEIMAAVERKFTDFYNQREHAPESSDPSNDHVDAGRYYGLQDEQMMDDDVPL
ncbi:MAG TPA: hypothetical protein VIE65_01590, partial [Methylobacter sp.]